MSLDMTNLVLRIEDCFDVSLPDFEFERVRTVADLATLVVSKLPRSTGGCVTARTFYELRQRIERDERGASGRLRPGTRLDTLPPLRRRSVWRTIRKRYPDLPQLEAAPIVDHVILVSVGMMIIANLFVVGVAAVVFGSEMALLAAVGAITIVIALMALSGSIGWRLPAGFQTIGDVVRHVAPLGLANGTPGERLIAQQRVLSELRQMIADELGLDPTQVQAESEWLPHSVQ